jgi:hypothetical protein
VWGWQTHEIGDIGMGIIAPPAAFRRMIETPTEYHSLLEPSRNPDTAARAETDPGAVRYWLIGDWRRGRRFPIAPTIDNWNRELAALSQLLLHDVRVSLGQAEVTGIR